MASPDVVEQVEGMLVAAYGERVEEVLSGPLAQTWFGLVRCYEDEVLVEGVRQMLLTLTDYYPGTNVSGSPFRAYDPVDNRTQKVVTLDGTPYPSRSGHVVAARGAARPSASHTTQPSHPTTTRRERSYSVATCPPIDCIIRIGNRDRRSDNRARPAARPRSTR